MNKQILIVDDNRQIREMLTEAFTQQGCQVACAANASEALALLNPAIKVMFLDLKLPGKVSGLDLCREIRKKHPSASIFAMTGHSSLFELADCRKAGFDDYFTKPTRLEMLFMAAEQAFARIEAEDNKQ
ncbi:MAG: response regulator [Desulfurivibrionaceae bacterium]|nr:response regulator [Desulfobulbales bacterium]MDT8335101.1 response regulator [Desulfurivibrionaceae bacterium]